MLKLPLKPGKKLPDSHKRMRFPWATCAPFVENRRGLLIHRPRSVATFTLLKKSHYSVHYWCGNCVNNDSNNITLLDTLPETALLCEACERNAVAAGLPSADELVGRHVHRGKLKAIMTCRCAALQGESHE